MFNVAIVDDRKKIRLALKSVVGNNTFFHVIFDGGSVLYLVKKSQQKSPHLVLIGDAGCTAHVESEIDLIQKTWPAALIVLLPYTEEGNSMELLKTVFDQRSKEKRECNGEQQSTGHKKNSFELAGLTRREKEILEVLLKGLSYKQVAIKSFISVNTLNAHIRNIYHKLQVHSKAELITKFGSH